MRRGNAAASDQSYGAEKLRCTEAVTAATGGPTGRGGIDAVTLRGSGTIVVGAVQPKALAAGR